MTNSDLTVHARTIAMTMGTQKLRADTDVRSVMERKPDAGRGRGGAAPGSEPTQAAVAAEAGPAGDRSAPTGSSTMARTSHALYTGAARLTQPGGTELQADTIEIDDASGNLKAQVKVRTRMMMDDVDPKTKQRTSTETIGTADNFVYEDAKRLATYTSTGTVQAHLVGPTGDLTGKRIDLFLKQGANELERLEADGEVTTIETNRTGARPPSDLHGGGRDVRAGRARRSKWWPRSRPRASARWPARSASGARVDSIRDRGQPGDDDHDSLHRDARLNGDAEHEGAHQVVRRSDGGQGRRARDCVG